MTIASKAGCLAADFERQQQATLLNCPLCGSTEINKGLHAPYVQHRSEPQRPQREVAGARAGAVRNIKTSRQAGRAADRDTRTCSAFPEEAPQIHYRSRRAQNPRPGLAGQVSELRDEASKSSRCRCAYLLDKTH